MVVCRAYGFERVVELCVLWPAYGDIGIVCSVRFNNCDIIYDRRIQDCQSDRVLFGMAIYRVVDIRVLFKWCYCVYELNL